MLCVLAYPVNFTDFMSVNDFLSFSREFLCISMAVAVVKYILVNNEASWCFCLRWAHFTCTCIGLSMHLPTWCIYNECESKSANDLYIC